MFDPSFLLPPQSGKAASPTTTRLFDALREVEAAATIARNEKNNEQLGHLLQRSGSIRLILGETNKLVDVFQEAEMLVGSSTMLHLEVGCALCYTGYYLRGKNRMEQAYKRNPTNEMTRGLFYAAMGLLYYRDLGRYDEAFSQLNYALETLQDQQIHTRAAVLIGMADLHNRRAQLDKAQEWLDKADEHLKKHKIFWHRPMWYATAARHALLRKDHRGAIGYTRKGLGAVDDRGDLRSLPMLYRMLASGMEANPDLVDDARDARQRSVVAARARASRIELAHALYELGQHFKLFYRRTTQRARGAGYLYEAEQIFRETGTPSPGAENSDAAVE
jgi:tetratricopeptide (TPR) repeat protein